MKRALIITTVSGFVPQFEMNNVKILQELGYEVHYATNYHMPVYTDNNDRLNGTGIIRHQIDFVRSPYHVIKNIKALKQLVNLMRKIKFSLVHCHTPMGGVLGRIAAFKTNTKPVIYTAHGFHFYSGAPMMNWLFFYPVERWLAKWTDCLITINQEDYQRAKTFSVRGEVEYVAGVGIDLEKYQNIQVDRQALRKKLGVPEEAFLLISVGELSKRKNHSVVIQALSQCKEKDIYYIICGSGVLEGKLLKLIEKYTLQGRVKLLGYRTDIPELLSISDCFIFPSLQEGLPVAVMEALAVGLPVICSDIRGNRDFKMKKDRGFLLVEKSKPSEFQKKIVKLMEVGKEYRKKETIIGKTKYNSEMIIKIMKKIYSNYKKI